MFSALAGRTPDLIDSRLYRQFAVAAPFLPETGEFLFQVRSDSLRRQPGEICFPGGRLEPGETPLRAAVRETVEELLIPEAQIEVVAPLDTLITPYYTVIYPFLTNVRGYAATFNRDEVREVFTVPFSFFLENPPRVHMNRVSIAPSGNDFPYALLGVDSYPWSCAEYPVLFYSYEGRVIWGMTAKFVNNIVELYQDCKNS